MNVSAASISTAASFARIFGGGNIGGSANINFNLTAINHARNELLIYGQNDRSGCRDEQARPAFNGGSARIFDAEHRRSATSTQLTAI